LPSFLFLEQIFQAFTFPDEYYAQLFRLRGLEYSADCQATTIFWNADKRHCLQAARSRRARRVKKVIPKAESGRRKAALSQALTKNIGCLKLREHLGATVAYMTMSEDYLDFMEKLNKYRPRFGEQYVLPFDYEPEKDDSTGL
jgi:hypothetical protein